MCPSPGVALALRDVDIRSATIKLESITLTVPSFSRFALLGPPGCGKSLLVEALTGQVGFAAGSGYMLGRKLEAQFTADTRDIGSLRRSGVVDADDIVDQLVALQNHNPRLVVLDDLLQGLRDDERQRVIDCIQQVSAGRTLIFTTASLRDVHDIATHVALIHAGYIMTQGTTDTIFQAPDTAHYRVVLLGDASIVYDTIRTLTWIRHIEAVHQGEKTIWHIRLIDEADAPTRLLRAILADRSLKVLQFNQLQPRIADFLAGLPQS